MAGENEYLAALREVLQRCDHFSLSGIVKIHQDIVHDNADAGGRVRCCRPGLL